MVLHKPHVVLTPLPKTHAFLQGSSEMSRIEALCTQYALHCSNIVMNATSATISIDSNEEVIVSLQKDLGMQIASLQLTIAHLTIEGKRFSRLDFRFDKPVLTY